MRSLVGLIFYLYICTVINKQLKTKIMVLGKKAAKQTEMQRIAQKNSDITSVFSRTVQDLKDVNLEMEIIKERKEAEAEALMSEIEVLNSQKTINEGVIDKINAFLS